MSVLAKFNQGCGFESGRIRTFLVRSGTGSGKFTPDTVYTQGINILNRSFSHFQMNFSIFSDKNNHPSNIRKNMFDVKKNFMFELILGKCQ